MKQENNSKFLPKKKIKTIFLVFKNGNKEKIKTKTKKQQQKLEYTENFFDNLILVISLTKK